MALYRCALLSKFISSHIATAALKAANHSPPLYADAPNALHLHLVSIHYCRYIYTHIHTRERREKETEEKKREEKGKEEERRREEEREGEKRREKERREERRREGEKERRGERRREITKGIGCSELVY